MRKRPAARSFLIPSLGGRRTTCVVGFGGALMMVTRQSVARHISGTTPHDQQLRVPVRPHHFLNSPAATQARRFAVAGIARGGAATNRPGARFGPRAIRKASHLLCDAIHPHFDISPGGRLGDAGDPALRNTSLEGMRAAMRPQVDRLIRAHPMCRLGVNHSAIQFRRSHQFSHQTSFRSTLSASICSHAFHPRRWRRHIWPLFL
ncbi:MAG: arginase family protein [Pseudomonadota bacterium]